MKKTLSLILAVMMLLGAFSITAFATTDNTTDITLTVAKPLTYEMVIPEDVTNLSNFGIYAVGQAKVENVKNATEKTVISYTAETTAFKCEGKTDIPASYYTDAQGTTAFPTTAVEVYKSKADAASIPTMYVGISETDWNAAENGTYTATVTYNFTAKETEAPAAVTAADALVTGAQFKATIENPNETLAVYTFEKTAEGFDCISVFIDGSDVTEIPVYRENYKSSLDGSDKILFEGWTSFSLTIYTVSNEYTLTNPYGGFTYTNFEVKPAGATEFTEVALTEAVPG